MTSVELKRLFIGGACMAFAVSYSVADIASRIIVARSNFVDALGDHLEMALISPFGTLLLAGPFFVIGWLSYRLAHRNAVKRGVTLLVAASIVLGYFYSSGLYGSQEALVQSKWTAAALSVGLLPFFVGIPTIAGAVLIYFAVRPRVAVPGRGET